MKTLKNNINKETIKKLLNDGVDKELIAFELDMPMEDIEKLSESLEAEKRAKVKVSQARSAKREKQKSELEELRSSYRKAYFSSDSDGMEVYEDLSKTEKALINDSVATTERILDEMPEYASLDKKDAEKYQRRAGARAIFAALAKIQSYPLSIEIAENFYYLLQSEKLKELNTITDPHMDKNVAKARGAMIFRLGMAINYAAMQTDDIDTLKSLQNRITTEMIRENPIAVSAIFSRISDKITRLKQEEFKAENKKSVPMSMKDVVSAIADGTLDIEDANCLIEKELKTSNTVINKEQERKKYLIYIADSLVESASEYHIINPEATIQKIQELSNGQLYYALRIVVSNMIERKEFSRAKELCERLLEKKYGKSETKSLINLKKEVENREFSHFVLSVINVPAEAETEQQYFDYIKREITSGKFKPSAISLGKAQNGIKNITLADVIEQTPNIEF